MRFTATTFSFHQLLTSGSLDVPGYIQACHRFGTCSYWDVCANGLKPEDDPERFERVESVHPELDLEEITR